MAKKNKIADGTSSGELARRLHAAHEQLRSHAARASRVADELAGLVRRFEASVHTNNATAAKAPRAPRATATPRTTRVRRTPTAAAAKRRSSARVAKPPS